VHFLLSTLHDYFYFLRFETPPSHPRLHFYSYRLPLLPLTLTLTHITYSSSLRLLNRSGAVYSPFLLPFVCLFFPLHHRTPPTPLTRTTHSQQSHHPPHISQSHPYHDKNIYTHCSTYGFSREMKFVLFVQHVCRMSDLGGACWPLVIGDAVGGRIHSAENHCGT
jgi:hypothetical protein